MTGIIGKTDSLGDPFEAFHAAMGDAHGHLTHAYHINVLSPGRKATKTDLQMKQSKDNNVDIGLTATEVLADVTGAKQEELDAVSKMLDSTEADATSLAGGTSDTHHH